MRWIFLECSRKALSTDWGRQGQALSRKPNATIKEKNSTQDSFVSLLFMYGLMCILLVVFQIARWILTEVSFAFILKRSANGPANTVWSFKFISLYFDFLFESIYSVTLTKIISMECKHEDRNHQGNLSVRMSNYHDSHVNLINKVPNTYVISVIYLFKFFYTD